mmetsp:Transcript_526/g.599  ORF Transcript_526/g.599 Transcript_526/m.599 type:complete len:87 (-) Transcript_526:6-266(-)
MPTVIEKNVGATIHSTTAPVIATTTVAVENIPYQFKCYRIWQKWLTYWGGVFSINKTIKLVAEIREEVVVLMLLLNRLNTNPEYKI